MKRKAPSAWEHMLLHMRVLQSVLREAEPALADLGLDPKGFFVLSVLDDYPSPAEISRALVLPRPTATSLIKRAEEAGHIKRKTVPGDLRRFHLSLTAKGRRVMLEGRQVLDQVMRERLHRITRSDQTILEAALEKLADE